MLHHINSTTASPRLKFVARDELFIAQLKTVLVQCNIFKGSLTEPDLQVKIGHMFKILSKEIPPTM